MKDNKINQSLKNIINKLDRNQLEVFLASILHHKLGQFTKQSCSTEYLRLVMMSLPHFDDAEKFMMLNTYEPTQIFKTYKQVFLSLIHETSTYTENELKSVISGYIAIAGEEDLVNYNSLFDYSKLAA